MAQQPNPARERVRVIVPKMIELSERSQDPDYTHVILVALPETTPVSEVAALQEDLRRAHIEAWAWVVNSKPACGRTAPYGSVWKENCGRSSGYATHSHSLSSFSHRRERRRGRCGDFRENPRQG